MSKVFSFNVTYDSGSDVLYITKRREVATRGREDEHGIMWRYDAAGDVLSATVLDFRELWEDNSLQLVNELSRGLHIPPHQAEVVVKQALGNLRSH